MDPAPRLFGVVRYLLMLGCAVALLAPAADADVSKWRYRTLTASETARTIKLIRGSDWTGYDTTYDVGAENFIAYSGRGEWCRDFGRFGDLRIKENVCREDGALRLTFRSVGEPVTFTVWLRIFRRAP